MNECAEIKRNWKAQRKAERQLRRDQRSRERRCFWTRPIGHAWEPVSNLTSRCLCCGAVKWIGGDL